MPLSTQDSALSTASATRAEDPREGAAARALPWLDAAPTLEPVLSTRWALGLRHAAVFTFFGIAFLYFNYLRLWHTDLWGHVAYGKWILEHRALPTADPHLPLAEGMQVVDTAWLAQVILAQAQIWGGAEWLSNLYAIVMVTTYLALARAFYLQTSRLGLSLLGAIFVAAVGWTRLSFIRPEMFGWLCFALLLWLVAKIEEQQRRIERWLETAESHPVGRCLLPAACCLLFTAWGNLHGSFLCGLAVLACCTLGRIVEVAWRTRSRRGVMADRDVLRWVCFAELAVAATLVNPYGLDLLIATARFGANENLRALTEWGPLVPWSVPGMGFALAGVFVVMIFRHSPRRVTATEVLLLSLFTAAAVARVRMIAWFAPVTAFVLLPHAREILLRLRSSVPSSTRFAALSTQHSALRTSSWRYSLLCLLVLWLVFTFSSLSRPILGGRPRAEGQLYSRYTPLGVSRYLREHPPPGQVWNPQVWGDWLAWDGPAGLRLFATTNVHLLPRQVWKDYLQVHDAQAGWQQTLERYAVTTVVVDQERQPTLTALLRRAAGWKPVYEDRLGLVLVRNQTAEGRNASALDRRMSVGNGLRAVPILEQTQPKKESSRSVLRASDERHVPSRISSQAEVCTEASGPKPDLAAPRRPSRPTGNAPRPSHPLWRPVRESAPAESADSASRTPKETASFGPAGQR